METLTIMRHAESVFNARGILNGEPSVAGGLTEHGRAQALRARALLASEPLDLCVTTNFQRCVETADIILERRDVLRIVMTELNDPPAGELELRPSAELVDWRARHGPGAFVPGTDAAEYFSGLWRGFSLLADRPEHHILAVIHGEGVAWLLSAAGYQPVPPQGEPVSIDGATVRRALEASRGDVLRFWTP